MKFKIELLDGNRFSWPVSEVLYIGTDSQCHIRIQEQNVSDRHCRIEIRNDKLFIKDLRSQSGTLVNDARILEAQLNDGDIITIGRSDFVIHDLSKMSPDFPLKSLSEEWSKKIKIIQAVAGSEHSVLLLGQSGTGKDVIAKTIHENSERKKGPFLSVNCSALTESLIESELFGHIKGSFTGAINDRKGAFEAARSGTLFLDEIGDLPSHLQAKLLRALENEEIRPVGSDKTLQTDVRIIAATHQNLIEKINEGSFRSDLYYRLNIITIEVPKLTERMEDFDSLLYQFAKKYRVRFSFSAIQKMKKYTWPGNIRELKNFIARTSTVYPKVYITDDLIDNLLQQNHGACAYPKGPGSSGSIETRHPSIIKEIEKQMIIKRLTANKGNQKLTAHDLGMPKSTLHDKIKSYQIDLVSFKF